MSFRTVHMPIAMALLAAAAPCFGETTAQRTVNQQGRTGAQTGQMTNRGTAAAPNAWAAGQQRSGDLSQKIAACLTLGNQEEVALAQIAQGKAQNRQVKEFAQRMIQDHTQALDKIRQAAPETAGITLTGAAQTNAPATQPNNGAVAQTAIQGPEFQLAESVKRECLQLSKQELNEKQGAEFDKCYIGMQVGAHMGMLAELRGSRTFANPQLQQVIADAEQVTEQHLTQAKDVMKQLESAQGATNQTSQASQRPAYNAQSAR